MTIHCNSEIVAPDVSLAAHKTDSGEVLISFNLFPLSTIVCINPNDAMALADEIYEACGFGKQIKEAA